jgi:pimeloyl-ACP methyl ester carboxylesterase
MAIANVGDINIYYEVHGAGEPLVLIMGYGFNSAGWFRQVPIFSQDYQVIIFDNRGTGRSDKPKMPYTMEMMTKDVAGLLGVIGVKVAHVFGISMGGMIAQHFALTYPEKVKTLILGCTSYGGPHSVPISAEAMSALFDIERIQNMTQEEIGKMMIPWFYTQQFIKFISENPALRQQMAARMMEFPTPVHGYMGQAAAVKGHDIYVCLPEIKVPTLVIAGEADRLMPVENSRLLAARIPNAELAILKNAGHGFITEAAEEANRVIKEFLKRHGSGRQVQSLAGYNI